MMHTTDSQPIEVLREALDEVGFSMLPDGKQARFVDHMYTFFAERLEGYQNSQPIRFDFDMPRTARSMVSEILSEARKRRQDGAVAHHLTGATLAIRFPHIVIGNSPYSAADDQAERAGDFQIGRTAFHVTVAPNPGHVQRCVENVAQGLSVYMIVSDERLGFTRTRVADADLSSRVSVEAIESFVGQNLSELSEFGSDKLGQQLMKLLTEYNSRVGTAETDDSLRINIPSALQDPEA